MKSYIEIKNQEDIDHLIQSEFSFHDSMVKEMQILNRGFVNKNRSMDMSHRFDCKILIQTQWKPEAIEVVCIGVKVLNIVGPEEFMGASGSVKHSPETEIMLSLDD